MANRTLQWPFAAVLVTAAFLLLHALWIPAKAALAQVLLEHAWQQTLAGHPDARPWPWADTRPVAVLEIPGRNIRQLVLEGASGRNLAFGPTLLTDPQGRDVILSGHRDTHFRFLDGIAAGERIRIGTLAGWREFSVRWVEVIDSRSQELVLDPSAARLTLVTCYPFDTPVAGGPLRLVVTALPHVHRGRLTAAVPAAR